LHHIKVKEEKGPYSINPIERLVYLLIPSLLSLNLYHIKVKEEKGTY